MKDAYSRELIFFLHIQKTAGMTLQELLRKNLGRAPLTRMWEFISGNSGEGLPMAEALRRLKESDRLFMGHFGYGVHRHYPFGSSYITFLREPASRLVSLYYFSRTTPGSFYHAIARDRGLEQFLFKTQLHELDNGMTRQIAGDKEDLFLSRVPYGECDEALLEEAKANIERDFLFVGIQEHFLESVCLLSRTLRFRQPYYLTFNRAKKSKPEQEEGLHRRLREKNDLDCRLYQHYRTKFEETLARINRETPDLFSEYARKNEAHQARLRRGYRIRIGLRRILEGLTSRKRSIRPEAQ